MRFRDLRFPCDAELSVALGGEVRRVQVVDASITGARVEGLGPVARGEPVTLCRLEGRHGAVVVWSNGRQAGLRFVPPLTPGQLDALRAVLGAARPGAWGSGSQRFRELG